MQFNTKTNFSWKLNKKIWKTFLWTPVSTEDINYLGWRKFLNKILNFEQVMNPPLKNVKKTKQKKHPFPISFSNFSGKYILKTAFIIRFMYWYIQKRKQKKKDFLYLWPAMRGLFLLIHCGYMDRRLMCCMKCRNPSEYVYTWRYSEKKYHTTCSLVRIP